MTEEETRTVLIIDDNPDDLEFYVRLLKDPPSGRHYNVLTAYRGSKGIEIFQNHDIDCIFVDFNMPGPDGLNTIDEMRRLSGKSYLPVVILTGEPDQSIQARAARQGAMDYVVKDSIDSAEQLERVIDKVMEWVTSLT